MYTNKKFINYFENATNPHSLSFNSFYVFALNQSREEALEWDSTRAWHTYCRALRAAAQNGSSALQSAVDALSEQNEDKVSGKQTLFSGFENMMKFPAWRPAFDKNILLEAGLTDSCPPFGWSQLREARLMVVLVGACEAGSDSSPPFLDGRSIVKRGRQ